MSEDNDPGREAGSAPPPREIVRRPRAAAVHRDEDPVARAEAWGRAVFDGLKDTLREALDAGRAGAHEAQDAAWRRYEDKTKHRRHRRD